MIGRLSHVLFCQSSFRFKEAIFQNDMDRISSGLAIFERYLSRNAVDLISLPESIRKSIVKDLFSCPQVAYKTLF